MSVKSLLLGLGDKIRRFKKVMKERWLSVVIGILLTWSFLIIRISLAENLVYTSDDIYMIACEIVTESGPKFKEAAGRHKTTLEQYKVRMNQRTSENAPQKMIASAVGYPVVSWIFRDWDGYTAERGLDEALKILSRAEIEPDEQKIAQYIWEAGYQLFEFREKMISFRRVGRIGIGFYKNTEEPNNLRVAIKDAINNSETKKNDFMAGESWETAWDLCEANRKSILLLFLARSEYKGVTINRDLEDFKKIVEDSHTAKRKYSEKLLEENKNSPEGNLVARFADSDERRLSIVKAIQSNDMDEARYLIWQAKEEAKHNKAVVLDIAERVKVTSKNVGVGT
jgi:hypothetical protein